MRIITHAIDWMPRILALIAAVAGTISLCLVCLYVSPQPIIRLDRHIYDTWMRLVEKPDLNPVPVIVEIDDKSLEQLGQWPWPRTLLADLVEKILDGGAASVGLDILLAEPDRTSPTALRDRLKERTGIDIDLNPIPRRYLDNDLYFSDVIRGKPVVLGAFSTFAPNDQLPEALPRPPGVVEKNFPGAPVPRETIERATGFQLPLKVFSDAAPIGIFNVSNTYDGVVRSIPLLARAGDNIYPALSLRALMAALGRGTMRLVSNEDGLARIYVGNVEIPVEADGTFRPLFTGPARTYPYFSAADVLEGRIDKNEFEGRIVFIGSSAVGLWDARATPLDPAMPGVEAHATLIDNMLSGHNINNLTDKLDVQIIAIIVSACLACILFVFLSAMVSIPLALAAIGIYMWGSWLLFSESIFISPIYAILATIISGLLILPVRFWGEQKAKKQIKKAFSHYVAPEVVNRIASRGTNALAGETREVSILFTDVRGFTPISEKLEPGQLVRLLNNYFTPMTACVIAKEGTLDKFIGDALMAFWNAPLDVAEHQRKAVLATLDMQKKLDTLKPYFLRDFGVEIRIGAGIHSGEAQVGNMGSEDLFNYTCIGDNVNLASRLESLCKRYGVGIIVSDAIRNACAGAFQFRPLDRVSVKGSHRSLEIFSPLDPDSAIDSIKEAAWRNALEAYFTGDFAAAIKGFSALRASPAFVTAAGLFIGRCELLLREKGSESWNGTWAYDTK